MVQYRDVVLKQQHKLDRKQDRPIFQRAVLTDAQGNQTGSGSVWADEALRRVWAMVEGAIQPGQVLCTRISDPAIGLGVIVGYGDGANEKEVLSDDFFLRRTGDPTGWYSTSPRDLEPGGIKNLWVYSKVITPLATYPAASGLFVNVIAGDYPYLGTRKTFTGSANFALIQNPNVGQHYYAGLYLNASNVLTVIYGASVVVAATPTEPAWPAGAFRLSVVRINHTQTSIDFDADVLDRRMAWSDELGSSGWPFDKVYTVSLTNPNVDYPTLAAALAAVPEDAIILLDGGDFPGAVTVAANGVSIVGLDKRVTSISSSSTDTVTITGAGCSLFNLTIVNSASSGSHYALVVDNTNVYVQDCILQKLLGSTLGAGLFHLSGTDLKLENVEGASTGATSNYGYYNITNDVSVTIIGGSYRGATADIYSNRAGSTLVTQRSAPYLFNSLVTHSGTTSGEYTDIAGNLLFLPTTGSTGGVWRYRPDGLRIKESTITLADTNGADDDEVHLFPGTYDLGSGLSLTKKLHFVGEGDPRSIIITGSGNFTIEPTDAGCTFRNLTLKNTAGGGTDRDVVQWQVNNIIFENCILTKTGAADDSTCFLQYGGTGAQIINCEATTTGATKNYAYWNNTATAACEIRGGKLSGSTWDIFGDQALSTLTLIDPILANASKSFSGTAQGEAFDQYGRRLRVKPAGVNAVRLTLTTGTPVTSADVTGATTVYAAPYQGSEIEVYNSSFWIECPFAEISVAVPSTIYRLFDVFVYDNAGALTLETTNWNQSTGTVTGATNATPIVITHNGHGYSNGDTIAVTGVGGNTAANGIWTISGVAANTYTLDGSAGSGAFTTNGTDYRLNETRATGLSLQNGRYCKTGTLTRLYLGTGMTTATSGQIETSKGGLASKGTESKRLLWNYYNRIPAYSLVRDSDNSWTYATATWRFSNNSQTKRVTFVIGVVEDAVRASFSQLLAGLGGGVSSAACGMGVTAYQSFTGSTVFNNQTPVINGAAIAIIYPAVGYNYFQAIEYASAATATFYGDAGGPTFVQDGLEAMIPL